MVDVGAVAKGEVFTGLTAVVEDEAEQPATVARASAAESAPQHRVTERIPTSLSVTTVSAHGTWTGTTRDREDGGVTEVTGAGRCGQAGLHRIVGESAGPRQFGDG